jgi:3(or 17)beta-hydroxysteroid dehydrogenase
MTDKVALVTGAGSGIGRATAALLAREGARVVVTDRNEASGAKVAGEIGDAAIFRRLDVTRPAEWTAVVDETVERFERLDALVNNAGVGVVKDVESTTLEEWRFVHAVNVEGPLFGCQNAIRVMKGRGGGSIVNVSSIAGIVGAANLTAYCASKAGLRLLSKSVALHCARQGYRIRCNSVHPSFVATPMVEEMIGATAHPDKMRQQIEAAAPLGGLGEADDVAYMILYLASDESKFVTGAELVVDGGTTAR